MALADLVPALMTHPRSGLAQAASAYDGRLRRHVLDPVEDLHTFDRALAAGTLLPAKAVRRMETPEKGERSFGCGWLGMTAFGRWMVGHNGGLNGFQAALHRYPDDGVCVVVLQNTEEANFPWIPRDLAAIVFGENYAVPAERKVVRVAPEVLDRYVGRYELPPEVFGEYVAGHYADRAAEARRGGLARLPSSEATTRPPGLTPTLSTMLD
jgi:hypothetical protein